MKQPAGMKIADKRISEIRTPWDIAQEIGRQQWKIDNKRRGYSHCEDIIKALRQELDDLVGPEETERLISQARDKFASKPPKFGQA